MKKKFLDYAINTIHTYNPSYDDIKLAELRYGLEGMYLSITKLIIIFTIAIALGILKEMLILLIIFNILRTTGFGLHATKSWICLVSSITVFIGLPYIATILTIPTMIKYVLAVISTFLIFMYAPADTKKRPLINKKKRTMYKIITTTSCIILNILAVFIKDTIIANLFILGIWVEVALILPISYKLFHFSYNNYKNYKPLHG